MAAIFTLVMVGPAALASVGVSTTPVCQPSAELAILVCASFIGYVVPAVFIISAFVAAHMLKWGGVTRPYAITLLALPVPILVSITTVTLSLFGSAAQTDTKALPHLVLLVYSGLAAVVFLSFYLNNFIFNRLSTKVRRRIGAVVVAAIVLLVSYLDLGGRSASYAAIDKSPIKVYAPIQRPGVTLDAPQPDGSNSDFSKGLYFGVYGLPGGESALYEYPAKPGSNPAANCNNSPFPTDTSDTTVCSVYGEYSGVTVYQEKGSSVLYVVMGQTLIIQQNGNIDNAVAAPFLASLKPVTGKQFYASVK